MSLVLAYRTNTIAGYLPVYARLKAGGFHPVSSNFEHGHIATFYLLALGGFDIFLPAQEIEDARAWMAAAEPIEDYDPIPPRPIRDVVQGTILSRNVFFPLFLLPPAILLGLWVLFAGLVWGSGVDLVTAIFADTLSLCIIAILADAKQKADSRRTRKTHVPDLPL